MKVSSSIIKKNNFKHESLFKPKAIIKIEPFTKVQTPNGNTYQLDRRYNANNTTNNKEHKPNKQPTTNRVKRKSTRSKKEVLKKG